MFVKVLQNYFHFSNVWKHFSNISYPNKFTDVAPPLTHFTKTNYKTLLKTHTFGPWWLPWMLSCHKLSAAPTPRWPTQTSGGPKVAATNFQWSRCGNHEHAGWPPQPWGSPTMVATNFGDLKMAAANFGKPWWPSRTSDNPMVAIKIVWHEHCRG